MNTLSPVAISVTDNLLFVFSTVPPEFHAGLPADL